MTCPVARFDIVLDNPMGIYHPGDLVIGRTELTLLEDVPIEGEHLQLMQLIIYNCPASMDSI